jgi:GntR family transcriptional regulator/MocR family aminotransferase
LRERITSGYIPGGTKLASTRTLALELAIARGVVLEAIDQLRLEGYLETRQGSGAYVREGLVWDSSERGTIEHSSGPERSERPSAVGRPATRADASLRSPAEMAERAVLSFAPGIPDLSLFPRRQWLSCYHDVIEYADPMDLAYTRPAGDWELRKEIASYLREIKGINVGPERIIVTAGASQAFGILCEIIPSAKVAMENPVAPFVRRVFDGHGANVSYVPVDSGGIREDLIPEGRLDYVYVTPSHQFPLGGCLNATRRVGAPREGRSCGAWVIEDDFDSEFRTTVSPGPAPRHGPGARRLRGNLQQGLEPSFTARLHDPPARTPVAREDAQARWDLWSEGLQQKALRNFIERGHLARHLARTSRIYRKKRATTSCRSRFRDSPPVGA